MPNIVKCPACRKALKLGEAFAGKRVRCPACQHPFTAPAPEKPEEVEEVEEVQPEPSRRESEEDDRPRKRRRPRDEEEDRPRRGRRERDEGEVVYSGAPLGYGILACVISCAPVVGFVLGSLAISKSNDEMAKLPGGKRSRQARKSLRLSARLGTIGIVLSVVWLVVALVLKILDWRKK